MNERLRVWLLAGISIIVYGNTLANSFTYDDFPYVLNNPAVTTPTLRGFFRATVFTNVFRPLTFATFAFNWLAGGVHAAGYHLVNILLHAAVAILLYLVLRKLLQGIAQGDTISFVAALLFALHPIHTEAVASIVGRSELLAACFLLAAWWLHLQNQWLPEVVCFVLAMAGKESAIAFLPLVVAGDYARREWKPLSRYLILILAAVAYAAALFQAQGGTFGEHGVDFLDNPLAKLSVWLRIPNALRVAWKYVALQIFPAKLSFDYSYNAIRLYGDWVHNLPVVLITLAVIALWLWAVRVRRTPGVLAGAIYLGGFAATSNVLMPIGTIMGERLAYLPSAGFCLTVALLWAQAEKRQRALSWAALALILVALGWRTVVRNRDWRSNTTLYLSAAKVVPDSARVHLALGAYYMETANLDAARKELQTSLEIYPPYPEAAEFLGLTLARGNDDQGALPLLQRALSLTRRDSPRYIERALNLAVMQVKLGRNEDAMKMLKEVLAQEPQNPRAWANRAVLRYRSGDVATARSEAQTALKLDPFNKQALDLLQTIAGAKDQRSR